jgi:hypothetical protein
MVTEDEPHPSPEQVRAIEAPGVTHIKYRVVNGRKGRPAEYRVASMGLH